MLALSTPEDLSLLKETVELECKLAQGRDGRGQVPEDFWPTYSAFANTRGGTVILGIREKRGRFEIGGIADPEKIRTDLFTTLNNRQKVNLNLIGEDDIRSVDIDGKSIVVIDVPAANRRQKPIFINGNPITGTYRRLNEADQCCDSETVRRMLAEQVDDTRDARILVNYGLEDISFDTLRTYRQLFRGARPGHPYLDQTDADFLKSIGGWRINRETKEGGLTVAGLLMFGKGESIREEFPNYSVDYQERPNAKSELRWIDRLTVDGTWSGNIFDFFRLTYRRLAVDLRVPFALRDGQRQDETPVHVALREALVNCLVHADYDGRASIFVVKRPDMFGFRNPGLMRVPVTQAIEGGESDGRNRILQQMFLLVGAGERAGSGVPKIYKGWKDQHWRAPALYQRDEPSEQTLLELRMADLLPSEVIEELRETFGSPFDSLEPDERLILATAATEGLVNHARMSTICDQHPVDLTRMLQGLVQGKFLAQTGRGRGAAYHIPGSGALTPDTVFGPANNVANAAGGLGGELGTLGGEQAGLGGELGALGGELSDLGGELAGAGIPPQGPLAPNDQGRLVDGLPYPLIDDLDKLSQGLRNALRSKAFYCHVVQRASPKIMSKIILALCQKRFVTLRVLADLVDREEKYLRDRIINPMIERGEILRAFPQSPNDPRQAYAAAEQDTCD